MGRPSRSKHTYRRLLGLSVAVPILAAAAFIGSSAIPASASSLFNFIDAQTGLCLDSNYSNPAYPAVGAVYTDSCNGGTYQRWT